LPFYFIWNDFWILETVRGIHLFLSCSFHHLKNTSKKAQKRERVVLCYLGSELERFWGSNDFLVILAFPKKTEQVKEGWYKNTRD
jgi:hypothetical protein